MSLLNRLLTLALNPRSGASRLPPLLDRGGPVQSPAGVRRRVRVRDIALNFPLLLGGVIVLGLFLVVLFGPLWAPSNPYISGQHIVPHFDPVKDEWISPPLEPSAEYPLGTDEWGNDILSMLLYGARNTLVASAFITMVRVLLGLGLGAYAGWNAGGLGDRAILGVVGLISSVPMLISSMILIFALDIRRGLPVFIIALALIGWTEITQYIRAEFLVLRKMPFIEGARAVGSPSLGIAVRHVLPNLLPQLLVISFLEIGAVLMLLGELGFIGVYIGGGSHIALGDEITGVQVVTLLEAPEWGAMLAEGYRWLRAKPFIVFPPALAFFIAVVGFNTLSEGLRRLIEVTSLNTNFLLRKRMLLVMAGLTLGTVFIINNTGPAPWFAQVARAFDGQSAYAFTRDLAAMDGRGAGQPGSERAAAYIAAKFQEYGLQPGWRSSAYIYPREVRLVQPRSAPELALLDEDGRVLASFRPELDFGFRTAGHGGTGLAQAPLTFVGFPQGPAQIPWEAFQGLDLRGRIALVLEGNAPPDFATEALIRGALGVLWVTGSQAPAAPSQVQLPETAGEALVQPTLPVFHVQPGVAQAILAQGGLAQEDLFAAAEAAPQRGPGWFAQPLDIRVRMALDLDDPQAQAVPTVMGFLPGSDFTLANEMVVVIAHYDGLGTGADGTVFPAANHNASGVGLLLELARLWQEQALNPRRTVLFVAWGGGALDQPGARAFLEGERSFSHLPAQSSGRRLAPRVVLQLDSLGAGGPALSVPVEASGRLQELAAEAAGLIGVPVTTAPLAEFPAGDLARVSRAAWILLSWQGPARPPDLDTFDRISGERLGAAGQVLSHMLTKIVRESRY